MIINVNSTYSTIYPLKVTVQLQTKRNNLYPLQFPVNRIQQSMTTKLFSISLRLHLALDNLKLAWIRYDSNNFLQRSQISATYNLQIFISSYFSNFAKIRRL